MLITFSFVTLFTLINFSFLTLATQITFSFATFVTILIMNEAAPLCSLFGAAVIYSYHTHCDILEEINRLGGPEKAAFLSSTLNGHTLMVLSNLTADSRTHYPFLVAAFESRLGNTKKVELHWMKLRNRVTC